ncbi:MAG TPA: hypothetical protein VM534_09865 [Thermoanaerobaculia bacterium]|nr:hypothetical protein [Thermoanaerobaculia bacterium]
MPYCPVCRKHFAEENEVCPEHGAELVGELPYQTLEGPDGSTWVEIENVGTEDEANLLKGFLEAEGIPAQIESLKFHMEPVNFGGLGEIRVYVNSERQQEAVELLRRREQEYSEAGEEEVMTDDGPSEISDEAEPTEEPA